MDADFSLYNTALNGMGLGTTQHDIERMYQDHKDSHREAEAGLLLEICIKLTDLARAEAVQKSVGSSLVRASNEFASAPTADRADWCRTYADRAVKATEEAKAAYSTVGTLWRAFAAMTK